MPNLNSDEYFKPNNYASYLTAKFFKGDVGKAVVGIFAKIRKYTFISSIIRTAAFIIALLEKSAILLLLVTALILLLPIIILCIAVYRIICRVKYSYMNSKIREWLVTGEKVTVFITKERIFSNGREPLFLRQAKQEANEHSHPVIVVCTDPMIAGKWYSLNLLAIKTDYFFILKRKFLENNGKNTTYIVL